jgi:hypothetical protein
MRNILCGAAVLVVVAAAPVAAQSVSGTWEAAMNTPGGPRPFTVLLAQRGDSLTGTVKRASGDSPLRGTVKGNDVAFQYSIVYNGNPITMAVKATVAGEEMKGSVDIAGQMEESFSARRTAAAPR